jgi:3-oxoacyl-[acyl-carrier protein] reductase
VDLGLNGRTALVFGASSGLGLASAEALAEEGANVALFARRADLLGREAERIGGHAIPGDVTKPEDLQRAVSATLERFGGLDVLVWNAGGPPPGTALETTPSGLEQGLALMLLPVVRLVELCLPHLARSGTGRVIAITSLVAKEPSTHLAISNAYRPAVTGWLKTLSRELGPHGITVNCVAPGNIATARLEQLYPEGPSPEQLAGIPAGRWGEPRELGDIVCFLASDRARYVSGQTIVVDGGLSHMIF